jgi:hypothetical protein
MLIKICRILYVQLFSQLKLNVFDALPRNVLMNANEAQKLM